VAEVAAGARATFEVAMAPQFGGGWSSSKGCWCWRRSWWGSRRRRPSWSSSGAAGAGVVMVGDVAVGTPVVAAVAAAGDRCPTRDRPECLWAVSHSVKGDGIALEDTRNPVSPRAILAHKKTFFFESGLVHFVRSFSQNCTQETTSPCAHTRSPP
jgi:hypothetical protein